MVAQGGARQSSCNSGELSRDLAGRVDIKPYYSGGLRFKNVEPVPQSGFRQMDGSKDLGPVRGRAIERATSGVATNYGPLTGAQTVWSATIAGGDVAAVLVVDIAADTGSHTLTAEVFDGASWTQIGTPIAVGTSARFHTFAAPPGMPMTATQVRLRCTFSTSATLTLTAVTPLGETETQDVPIYGRLRHDSGDRYFIAITSNWMDIWRDDTFVAAVFLTTVSSAILPDISLYTENATIGIFHGSLQTLRIRRAGSAHEWDVDFWPYAEVPNVDLGETYSKTADAHEIFINWSDDTYVYMAITVNGETTPSVPLADSGGTIKLLSEAQANHAYWAQWAADLEDALEDLPSLGSGVTVLEDVTGDGYHRFLISFGGNLAGEEYSVTAQIANTTKAATLTYHVQIGETAFEPLISALRGYPALTGLVQDRLAYAGTPAEKSAVLLSQAAEYFNLNIAATGADSARLDRLRAGQTAEQVRAILDSTYLLVFTDHAVHFAANRTISKNEPLNYTQTSSVGIVAGTRPVELEGKVYYAAYNDNDEDPDKNGYQVISLAYDEIVSRFEGVPESLLATHLVAGIARSKGQKAGGDKDAHKMWLMRDDGRLIAGCVIRSQEILGFCEWIAAAGGAVREIDVDARNQLRLCIERGGRLRHERMTPDCYLHGCVTRTADLAGVVNGLDQFEDAEVWAIAEGYVLGPFTVDGGEIDLGDAYAGDIMVGYWQPPLFESMPRYRILPNDEMLVRPGRIHTAFVNVIDTTSIAAGANGQTPLPVPLADMTDPLDAPMPAKTKKLTANGTAFLGAVEGTTFVITQTKPGSLRVRDYVLEERL